MPLEVFISERAEKNLDAIVKYLEKEWSEKVKKNFIKKIGIIVRQISNNPEMFPASESKKNIRKAIVTKHTAIYYSIKNKKIQLITIQDNRQNAAFFKI